MSEAGCIHPDCPLCRYGRKGVWVVNPENHFGRFISRLIEERDKYRALAGLPPVEGQKGEETQLWKLKKSSGNSSKDS